LFVVAIDAVEHTKSPMPICWQNFFQNIE